MTGLPDIFHRIWRPGRGPPQGKCCGSDLGVVPTLTTALSHTLDYVVGFRGTPETPHGRRWAGLRTRSVSAKEQAGSVSLGRDANFFSFPSLRAIMASICWTVRGSVAVLLSRSRTQRQHKALQPRAPPGAISHKAGTIGLTQE